MRISICFLVLLFFVSINDSFACSRFGFGLPTAAKFTQTDAVFIGKAIGIEDLTGKGEFMNNAKKIKFKVIRLFKGPATQHIDIITPDWRAACGLRIRTGQRWLIYANGIDAAAFGSDEGHRYDLKDDLDEISILDKASRRETETTISGRLVSFGQLEYKFETADIALSRPNGEIKSPLNSDGTFAFADISPGNYVVTVTFPFRASIDHIPRQDKPIYVAGPPTIFTYNVKLTAGNHDYIFLEVFKHSR